MRVIGVVVTIVAVGVSGCHSVKPLGHPDPGATGYAFIMGCAAQRYSFPEPVVERAMLEAMNDMGIQHVKKSREEDVVSLCGSLFDDRIIKVSLEGQEGVTIARMRVDYYGDEPFSKILIDRTSARLSVMPPEVIPPNDPRTFSDSATHRGQNLSGYRGAPLR